MKKLDIKKIIITNIILFLIICFGATLLLNYQYKRYQNNNNIIIYNLINEVKSQYPNVDEQEIIKLLNSDDIKENEIIKKYRIDLDDSIIESNKKLNKQSSIEIIIYILMSLTILLIIFILFQRNRDKQINNITNYIKELNNKNYKLDIDNNGEGELSLLKNEIYKTTVLLNEQAQISKQDKESIKISVQDISHQLKTPLTSITIMLDNIIENPAMEDDIRNDFIKDIKHQIDNINNLVKSLLTLSRFDANVIEFKKEEINVKILIQDIIKNTDILRELKQVNIKSNVKDIIFIGDYSWEKEALTNIIKNCIEHTPENKSIYIDCDQNNFYTKIVIRDEGCGVDKEDLKHLYDRFYRGKNPSNDSIGIGLSLSKTIINKDNGYIKTSSVLNEGTTFEIKYMK